MEKRDEDKKIDIDFTNEDDIVRDLNDAWNNEINQFSLLSQEEEQECGKNLKLVKDLIIVNSKNRINLALVLSNLTDKNASEILSNLKEMYLNLHENSLSKEEDLLLHYERKYNQLGRVLNDDELEKMGINKSTIIDEDTLLDQVNNYIKYNTSKYKMINSNYKLIRPIAKRYSDKFHIEYMDLVSEGNMGLMKAVDRFDVDKGFRFSTYATWWINHNIGRYSSKNFHPVKIDSQYWSKRKEFLNVVKELEDSTGKKYSALELSKILDVDYKDVLDYILYNPNITYLDQYIGDDEDTTFGELIPGEDVDFDTKIFIEELRDVFSIYLDKLPKKTARVISLLYGINDENRIYSEAEISKKTGLSKSVINANHNKALLIIRNIVRRNGEKDHLKHFK